MSDETDAVKVAGQRRGDVNAPFPQESVHNDPANTMPLIVACKNGKGQSALALLEAGADPNLRDASGKTPLQYCIKDQNRNAGIIEILLKHKADPNVGLAAPRRGPPVSFGDSSNTTGATPLMLASQMPFVKAVELLLHYGAKVDQKDLGGRTAFWYAGGKLSAREEQELSPETKQIRAMLLKAGANPDPHDKRGRTCRQQREIDDRQ
jgi:ankyrin repeat protein